MIKLKKRERERNHGQYMMKEKSASYCTISVCVYEGRVCQTFIQIVLTVFFTLIVMECPLWTTLLRSISLNSSPTTSGRYLIYVAKVL